MPWHTVRIRSDLHRILQTQAAMQSRSTAGQLDFVLSRALEQETGEQPRGASEHSLGEPLSPVRASDERADGETGAGTVSHRPSPSSVPEYIEPPPLSSEQAEEIKKAPRYYEIPGQTTVDEMLASCPQCAGEMQDYCLDDGKGGGEMATRCEDCGFVREPEGT
jgi:hypothetical protein